MANANPTDLTNSAGTGTVKSDGFLGPLTGNVTGNVSGTVTTAPQLLAAHGTSQQAASTVAVPGEIIVTVCSVSTRGIRLSVKTTGARYEVFNNTAVNCLFYPATAAQIDAGSTNAALKINAHKGAIFYYRSGTLVASIVGA